MDLHGSLRADLVLRSGLFFAALVAMSACGGGARETDAGDADLGGTTDAGPRDGSALPTDAGPADGGVDASMPVDAGGTDLGAPDASVDRCSVTTTDTTTALRSAPFIAWTGTDALVAYFGTDYRIHGAHVSASGAVSGDWSYALESDGFDGAFVWTGSALAALYTGCTGHPSVGCARYFVAFDPTGAVTAGPTMVAVEGTGRSALAWDGAHFAAAWQDNSVAPATLQFTELDATGTPLRADAPVAGFDSVPTLVAGPSSWLIAYDAVASSGDNGLDVSELDSAGVVGTTVVTADTHTLFSPVVVDTGTGLSVVYDVDSTNDLRHWGLTHSLAEASAPTDVATDTDFQGGVSAAWNGTRLGVVWYDIDGFARTATVRFVETSPTGSALGAPQTLAPDTAHQVFGGAAPPQAIVWTGGGWLIAWSRGETAALSLSSVRCPG